MIEYLSWTYKCPRRANYHVGDIMKEHSGYYIVQRQAIPEVLIKVVEAKKLLESGRVRTVNEAVAKVDISRSSFYKYKDDIYEFHDSLSGSTFTLTFQIDDEPGLLSDVLGIIARSGANILTIHQSIPIDGVASLSVSLQVIDEGVSVTDLSAAIGQRSGVHKVQISGRGNGVS